MKKDETYCTMREQIKSLMDAEDDMIATMANTAAIIHRTMGFWWTGFYIVRDGHLVIGPFQGPPACIHIAYGKGVCGTCWRKGESVVVPDVDLFPGHIACSAESRSEIVVPIIRDGKVIAVLDIDSERKGAFDDTDRRGIEAICSLLSEGRM